MRRSNFFVVCLVVFACMQFCFVWALFVLTGSGSSTTATGTSVSNKRPAIATVPTAPPLATCPPCPPPTSSNALSRGAMLAPPTHRSKPLFTMTIVVFTYNRIQGLQTLLNSLVAAKYGDRTDVRLHVFLDYPKKPNEAHLDGTRAYLDAFHWPHGPYDVHRRLANAGLKKTIMESWYPVGDDEVAAFFEDDIEVSKEWFTWVSGAMDAYFGHGAQGGTAMDAKLLGLSLFRPIKDELSGKMVREPTADGAPFLLQQPCSWGAVFFPRPWRAFRNWYDDHRGVSPQLQDPSHPEVRPSSNTWDSSSSWKKYLIKLMYDEGWFMVYPNFERSEVLSTNHLLPGVHPTPPKKLFELPLVPEEGLMTDGDKRILRWFPPLSSLRAYDVMYQDVGGMAHLHGYRS